MIWSSPVVTTRHLGTNEEHRTWVAICDGRVEGVSHPIHLSIPSKRLPSCAQRNGVYIQRIFRIHSYFHLISGVGDDLSFKARSNLPHVVISK